LIEGRERMMRVVNTEDENRCADLARRMVAAEVEDALTHRADEQPTAENMDRAALMDAVATSNDVEHVLIEVTAIAGEAVVRLSRELGEDPRATLEWIASTRAWRRPS
jgi:non-ribosomal peptide synthetase component F